VRVLPLSAKVYAVVLELRTAQVGSYTFEQCNSFRYRPDYFNADLLTLEHRMLSEPFEVFEFDFQHQYRREFIKVREGGEEKTLVCTIVTPHCPVAGCTVQTVRCGDD
jgi:hypothetical protein